MMKRLRKNLNYFVGCALAVLVYGIPSYAQTPSKKMVQVYESLSEFSHPYARNCANRADVWTTQLEREFPGRVKKMLVLLSQPFDPNGWGFHIAPLVVDEEGAFIFEKANGIRSVITPDVWFKLLTGHDANQCKPIAGNEQELINEFHPSTSEYGIKNKLFYRVPSANPSAPCFMGVVDAAILGPRRGDFMEYLLDGTLPARRTRAELMNECSVAMGLSGSHYYYLESLKHEHWIPAFPLLKWKIRHDCEIKVGTP